LGVTERNVVKSTDFCASQAKMVSLALLLNFLLCIPIASARFGNYSEEHRRLEVQHMKSLKDTTTTARLQEIVKKNYNYKSKFPFPHTYVDDIFPMDVLLAAANEIPEGPFSNPKGCVEGSSNCYNSKFEKHKNAFDKDEDYGPATTALFMFMKSSGFIKFLEKLTGIEGLIPDPHYRGSGIHQTLPGGYLNLHADFNRYEKYDLHRRVNAFIYLNPEWDDSWGGHLELWSKDLRSCGAKLAPTIGRFAVFSSTDFSYHGHPHPLTTPNNRTRRSLALYYYTRTRPSYECEYWNCYSAHSTLFKTPACKSCDDPKCKKYK